MPAERVDNVNIVSQDLLLTPQEIKTRLPLSETAAQTVRQGRHVLQRILDRQDPRLFVVVGPCSIHDIDAAHEYAQRLKQLADDIGDVIYPVMRVYFEKPRTTTGWKGLINDPYLDDSFKIEEGLQKAKDFGVDGIMVGRGIFHNPWFFNKQVAERSPEERLQLLYKHASLFTQTWESKKNFAILKRFFKIYTTGFQDASKIRADLMETNSLEEVKQVLEDFGFDIYN